MDRESAQDAVRWSSGVSALAGIWLIVAPFVLGYAHLLKPFWNGVLVGAALVVLALVRLGAPLHHQGLTWISAALGAWLFSAPFLLGYAIRGEEIAAGAAVGADGTVVAIGAEVASWNAAIVGMIVLILAARSVAAGGRPATLPVPSRQTAPGHGD